MSDALPSPTSAGPGATRAHRRRWGGTARGLRALGDLSAERAAPVAAVVALALFAVVGATQSGRTVPVAVTAAAAVVAVGLFLTRRAVTGWALVAGLSAAAAGVVVLCHADPGNVGWFGMCVLAGWAALGSPPRPAAAFGAGLVGVFGVEWAVSDQGGWGAWLAGTVFTVTACSFTRRQQVLVAQLEQAQAGLADRARAEERSRIAAELHDVIGHALTVTLLHLDSARLALDDSPDDARGALEEAGRLARASLGEVRAVVGLHRASGATAPLPDAAGLSELVDSFRRAGAAVELAVHGDLHTVGGTRGFALYRIVQESLTNAVRHGDGSTVVVTVDVGAERTAVSVLSGGTTPAHPVEGSGLLGMRERAEAVGGRLEAAPSSTGWRVDALLPS